MSRIEIINPEIYFDIIKTDERGKICLLKGTDLKEYPEITIHITGKGFARGGMIHKYHDEHCVVLEGEIEYHIRSAVFKMKAGDTETIPKGSPHYFVSLKNSIIAEWGPNPEEKNNKDTEMRKKVDEINNSQTQTL